MRPTVATLALVAAVLAGVAGCGSSDGQGAAMEACKQWTNATTGFVQPAARASSLRQAHDWASKAAAKAADRWQPLLEAIETYQQASYPATDAHTRDRLDDAHKVINASCEAAARGY